MGVCAGLLLLLSVSWLSAFVGVCWSPGCSPGCKVRGVMDRGGLDGLSFERGGRSADYVPASASFCWSLSASVLASVAASPRWAFEAGGLILFCASSSLPFEAAGWSSLACFAASAAPLGSAIHSSSPRCVGRSSLRCSLLTGSGCCSPRAARSRPSLVSFDPLASLAALSLAWLLGSPPWAGLASSARLGWLARLALALSYSRLLGGGNSPRLSD